MRERTELLIRKSRKTFALYRDHGTNVSPMHSMSLPSLRQFVSSSIKGNDMKKLNINLAAITCSVGLACTAISAVHAQAVCEPLTPTALSDMTAALDNALAFADVAAVAAGYDKDSPSTYPNALIRRAQQNWKIHYLDYLPPDQYAPFITPTNVAVALDGTVNIEVNTMLVNARWWSSASAYNYQLVSDDITIKYLETRRAVQAAMTRLDQLGLDGTRCSVLQFGPQFASYLP
jgi:hypothetical protein